MGVYIGPFAIAPYLSDASSSFRGITYTINHQRLPSDVSTSVASKEDRRSHKVLRHSPPTTGYPVETIFRESWILPSSCIANGLVSLVEEHSHIGSDASRRNRIDSNVVSTPLV